MNALEAEIAAENQRRITELEAEVERLKAESECELCGRTCDSELPAVCLACHNKVQAEYVRLKAKVREWATEEEDTVHEREKMSATEEKDLTRAFDIMNERDMIMASIDRLSENKAAKELADVAHYANMMLAEIVK